MSIVCSKCGVAKCADQYHKNSAAPGGLRLECKSCASVIASIAYKANPAPSIIRSIAWVKENRERSRANLKRYADKNREKLRMDSRKWQKANKAADAERSARQRGIAKQATPTWANKAYIALFYDIAKLEEQRTGRVVHVDHIYPLNSDAVCGLHVEHNLQLLFAEDNISKGNKLPKSDRGVPCQS